MQVEKKETESPARPKRKAHDDGTTFRCVHVSPAEAWTAAVHTANNLAAGKFSESASNMMREVANSLEQCFERNERKYLQWRYFEYNGYYHVTVAIKTQDKGPSEIKIDVSTQRLNSFIENKILQPWIVACTAWNGQHRHPTFWDVACVLDGQARTACCQRSEALDFRLRSRHRLQISDFRELLEVKTKHDIALPDWDTLSATAFRLYRMHGSSTPQALRVDLETPVQSKPFELVATGLDCIRLTDMFDLTDVSHSRIENVLVSLATGSLRVIVRRFDEALTHLWCDASMTHVGYADFDVKSKCIIKRVKED